MVAPPRAVPVSGGAKKCQLDALRAELKEFLQNGPQYDAATPLHQAAEDGEVDVVKALLAMGADVNEVDPEGQTPLFFAASWGNAEACKALIDGGAEVEKKDESGDTPLHEAARSDHLACVEVLIEAGATVDSRNELEATPLHVASHAGNQDIVQALIDAGAAVTGDKAEMKGGYSALHVAAANGSSNCLTALIENGASLRHVASEGMIRNTSTTALQLAEENNQEEASKILRKASVEEFEKLGFGF